jgi:hypothetical protein
MISIQIEWLDMHRTKSNHKSCRDKVEINVIKNHRIVEIPEI